MLHHSHSLNQIIHILLASCVAVHPDLQVILHSADVLEAKVHRKQWEVSPLWMQNLSEPTEPGCALYIAVKERGKKQKEEKWLEFSSDSSRDIKET